MMTKRSTIDVLHVTLYASTIAVAFSLTLLAWCLPAIMNQLDVLSQEWNFELAQIKQEGDAMWQILIRPEHITQRSRRISRDTVVPNGYQSDNYQQFDNNKSYKIQQQLPLKQQYQEQQTPYNAANKAGGDEIPRPPQLYSYTKRPEFGYGYGKLRCCCALNNYQPSESLSVSYKCPAGPPGPQGQPGELGLAGLDGRRGVDGQPATSLSHFDDGYGIRSNFQPLLRARRCGSCPQGPPGVVGIPGKIGLRGITGIAGKYGLPGLPGRSGPPGVMGDVGPQGKSGHPGVAGQRGLDGIKGEKGLPGVKGTPGAVGSIGSPGMPGPNGCNGKVGMLGPQGQSGLKGQSGMDGPDGAVGERGQPGKDGLYCKCPEKTRLPSSAYSNVSPLTKPHLDDYASTYDAGSVPIQTYSPTTSKYNISSDKTPAKSIYHISEQLPELTKTNKYLVENTHPPSMRPQMPSFRSAYTYDLHTRQYFPTSLMTGYLTDAQNSTVTPQPIPEVTPAVRMQTYGLPENTHYGPSMLNAQNTNTWIKVRNDMEMATKAAQTTMARADAFAYTPLFHKTTSTITTTTSYTTTTETASRLQAIIRTTTTSPSRSSGRDDTDTVYNHDTNAKNNYYNNKNTNKIGRYDIELPALPADEHYSGKYIDSSDLQTYKSTDLRLLYAPEVYESGDSAEKWRNADQLQQQSLATPNTNGEEWSSQDALTANTDERLPFEFNTEWMHLKKRHRSKIAH